MTGNYDHLFYADRHRKTVYAAQTILSLVLDALPGISSAADFGCGVGTWLSVLTQRGVSVTRGLDGPWVERDLLEIPKDDFQEVNFEEAIRLGRRYDLAISLEVAEHISDNRRIALSIRLLPHPTSYCSLRRSHFKAETVTLTNNGQTTGSKCLLRADMW